MLIHFLLWIFFFNFISKILLTQQSYKGSFSFNSKERRELLALLYDQICEETPKEEKVCCVKNERIIYSV